MPGTKGFENVPITVMQGHLDMVCEANAGTKHDFDRDPIRLIIDEDPHDGEATIETYVLRYRDGEASLASFACLLDDGRRTWARSEDPALLAEMVARETCGRRAQLKERKLVSL